MLGGGNVLAESPAWPLKVFQAHLKPHVPSWSPSPPSYCCCTAHSKPEQLCKVLLRHCCSAGSEMLVHDAGFYSQTAKCKPYYFWISKTVINT